MAQEGVAQGSQAPQVSEEEKQKIMDSIGVAFVLPEFFTQLLPLFKEVHYLISPLNRLVHFIMVKCLSSPPVPGVKR